MSTTDEAQQPALRIVRGNPTPEEIAVLTAVVAAAAASPSEQASETQRGRWNDPRHAHRRPLLPGPGAWRAAER
ncbi:MAG TPA: acyl-CoA carboxylase subunit epsilon [Jatrophihabitantaceae bacterium]|jgi:hypothetical protein|nr:acyl-CoA carboxylase subunit epsilon [Jatrophihabitantaceae bacterium]